MKIVIFVIIVILAGFAIYFVNDFCNASSKTEPHFDTTRFVIKQVNYKKFELLEIHDKKQGVNYLVTSTGFLIDKYIPFEIDSIAGRE